MDDPDVWEVFIAAKNYGAVARSVPMSVAFGGSPVATHRFELKPAAEENMNFRFKTRAAGWLEARLTTEDRLTTEARPAAQDAFRQDAFRQDSPRHSRTCRRAVSCPSPFIPAEPDLLRPIFSAIPGIQASFLPVSSYQPNAHGLASFCWIILRRLRRPPTKAFGWSRPRTNRPIPVRSTLQKVKLNQWQADHPLGAGLRARDIELASAEIFEPAPGDIVVARSDAGPLIVARPGNPKMVVLGFHPVRSGMKYQLTTPLLFANIIRWMAPDAFRSWELTAGTVGTVDVELESEIDPNSIRVQTEEGRPLPFTVEGKTLRFFTGAPGVVRVLTGDRELVYSLTLPQPGDTVWKPSAAEILQGVKLGLPGRAPLGPTSRDLWHWLALAGASWLAGGLDSFRPHDRRMRAAGAPASSETGLPWGGKPRDLRADLGPHLSASPARLDVFRMAADPAHYRAHSEDPRVPRHRAGFGRTHAHAPQTKMAVAVLVDTSSSVSPQDLARASEFAAALDKARGRHWVRVLPFARSVRDLAPGEQRGVHLEPTAGEAGRATDLESSIEEAISSLPSDLVPRIVLVSDGKENAGSITRAAWQAQRLGIPIDTVALRGRPEPSLRLESVTVPTVAFTGEQFPVDLSIVSPSAVSGSVQISAEGKVLGSNPVKLEKGDNQVRVHASLTAAGALSLAGVIQADGLGEIRFDRAVTLRRPKVLFISQDPAGTETHLLQTLAAAQFDVDRTADPAYGNLGRLPIGGVKQSGHGILASRPQG